MVFWKKDKTANTENGMPEGVNQAVKEIAAAFRGHEIRHQVHAENGFCAMTCDFKGSYGNPFTIVFISMENRNNVSVRCYHALPDLSPERLSLIHEIIGENNRRFCFVKFYLDGEALCMEYDIPSKTANIGVVAIEILLYMVKIVDGSWPKLMKAIWQ